MNQQEIPHRWSEYQLKEYNDLRDEKKRIYITDPSLINIIDKIEELTRALRKHIHRKY